MEAELRVVGTSLGSPLKGPFVPGEIIDFVFEIKDYQTDQQGTGNDCQWLQGIVPVFGNGWSPSSFVSLRRPRNEIERLSGIWQWLDQGEAGYNFQTNEYTIYQDPVFDRLAICKGSSPNCPGGGITQIEAAMPAGRYIVTGDLRVPCPDAGIDVDDSWGFPQACGTNLRLGTWEFSLIVRDYDDPEEGCLATGYTDLWVEVYTFTDAEIGCFVGTNEVCASDQGIRFETFNRCIPSNSSYRYYNQRFPICSSSDLDQVEINMSDIPPYPSQPWPGCGSADSLYRPHWVTFVANNENMMIDMTIENCDQRNGIRWALYELPCNDEIADLGVTSDPFLLGAPFGGCQGTERAQSGLQTLDFSARVGQLYGILIDGWEEDLCSIRFDQANNSPLPVLSEVIPEVPNFDESLYSFDGDTICIGAEDVEFRIPEIFGVCSYTWIIRSTANSGVSQIISSDAFISLNFPQRDTFELCVTGSNICDTTEQSCLQFYVLPTRDSKTINDTICEGDSYVWLDENEEVIREFPPFNSGGLKKFTEFLEDVGNCGITSNLDLFVRPENDEDPTLIDTFSCYVPGEEQSIVFFCDTISGIDTVPIQACISPSTGCDTFFSIEHNIIGGELNIVPVSCDGFGNMIFEFEDARLEGYTPWEIQTNKYANDPDFEIEFIWTTREGARNLGEGDQLVLPQGVIRQFAENENFLLSLEAMIYYRGDLVCRSMAEYSFSLRDNFPVILELAGDRIYNLGEENLKYWFRFRNPRNPQHNQSNDRVIVQEWTIPPGFRFLPPSDASSDTIYLAAPEVAVGNSQLCISVTTDQCLFSDEFCVELEQAVCPANIISLDSCGVFVFTVEDFGGPILGYQWQVQNGRIIGSSDGPIVVVEPGREDSTRVSVRIQSDCLGTGTFVIPPSDNHSIVEDLNENPRRIYRRNCDPGSLIVITESACAYRWGYIDSITNEYVFPLEGPDGNIWEEAYLEISDTVSPFRDYFVERVLDCFTNCESELIFSRSAEKISCNDRIFQIYPNPGTDKFKVRTSRFSHGQYQLKFMNIQGQWARTQDLQISQDDQISELILSGLASGLYQVVIEKDKEILDYQKLIIINR
jgi:hypothetical protein